MQQRRRVAFAIDDPLPSEAIPPVDSGEADPKQPITSSTTDDAPPRRLTSVQSQINSLKHFQQHSRLHFIGQWRTKAHDLLMAMYQEHPEWCHGTLRAQKLFIHVDMDAYFCSVALSKPENRHLRELPVAIAAGKQNSDVASCNYVARSFGVRAGMWVGQARELCPNLVTLGYDLPRCEELNLLVYRVLLSHCPPATNLSLEVYSVDEVVIAMDTDDLEGVKAYCETVRAEIERVTNGCTASCGVGPSVLIARLATAMAKPDGVFIVSRDQVPETISQTPIRDLHGMGRATIRKLLPHVVAKFPVEFRGADDSPMVPGLRKSNRDNGIITDEQLSKSSQQSFSEETVGPRENDTENGPAGANDEEDEEEEVSQSSTSTAILCKHVQAIPMSTLQQILGQKAGLILHQQVRGIDSRQVRRTGDIENQLALGKSMPASVACAMNYAVRPQNADDVQNIVSQLVSDVAAKLRRLHACATHAKISLLERHPDYPKTTTKFLGTGRCVEHHTSLSFSAPLTGEQQAAMEAQCFEAIRSSLVIDEGSKAHDPNGKVLIDDIRGATVTLSGINAIMRRSDQSTEMVPRIRRVGIDGTASSTGHQISLTAVFRSVEARNKKRQRDDVRSVVTHEIADVDEDEDDVCVVEQGDSTVCVVDDDDVWSSTNSVTEIVHVSPTQDCPVEVVELLSEPQSTLEHRDNFDTFEDIVTLLGAGLNNVSSSSDSSLEQWLGMVTHVIQVLIHDLFDLATVASLLRQLHLWEAENRISSPVVASCRDLAHCELEAELVARSVLPPRDGPSSTSPRVELSFLFE